MTAFRYKTDVGKLRVGAGVRLHLRYCCQVIQQLFTRKIDIGDGVTKRLHFQHIFIGDIARFNAVANAATAHHCQIRPGACHLCGEKDPRQVGLHKAHFAAIPFKTASGAANLHAQLRFAFVLERRQQREHLRVFGNFRRVEHAFALAVVIGHFLLQVDRDELVAHQFHLAVTKLEIRATNVFAPLMGLHNPGAILLIRCARCAGHIIGLLFILRGHADRIL